MRHNDDQVGHPGAVYTATKATLNTMAGITSISDGALAYATDTKELGVFTGMAWEWTRLAAIYGSMSCDDVSTSVTISSADVYYAVNSGWTGGLESGMTFQNAREIKVLTAGVYHITWGMSLNSGNNKHIEGTVMINTTAQESASCAAHTPGAGDDVGLAGNCILSLAVNDLIKLCVENEADTTAIVCTHGSLTARRLSA